MLPTDGAWSVYSLELGIWLEGIGVTQNVEKLLCLTSDLGVDSRAK